VGASVTDEFGKERWLFRHLTASLKPGQCTGIVGRNGAGKTTLIRLCMGERTAEEGRITIGKKVAFNYIDQARMQLAGNGTVLAEVADQDETVFFGTQKLSARSYLRRFLFNDDRTNERVDRLSGGERARLMLAKVLKRGGNVIVSRGRVLKRSHAALFASIEQRYGVPAGPLLAIWGMETGFGRTQGNQNALSAVATLAYDCRRSEFFSDQLDAALKLVDRGILSASSRGSMHGEVGHTQFLPKSVLLYSNGSLDDADTALVATANFLKAHGWRANAGYQPGEPNFVAIQAWNAATVYQRAIALLGRQIDGHGVAALD
jgi:membrane-bound lytic murein transglycosylase B